MVDHALIFWTCVFYSVFILGGRSSINKILGFKVKYSFVSLYLCDLPNVLRTYDKYLLKVLLAACKKAIRRHWLSTDPPTVAQWMDIANDIYNMESLTCIKTC